VELLRDRDVPVRAFVHREDERAEALRATGAEVVVGDLTEAYDVMHAMTGCRRMYFGMSPRNPIVMTIAASSIASSDTIRLPFGSARTSPIAARDVAEVIAAVLVDPTSHIGKAYELTGPRSQDMTAMAAEYSAALGRPVTYVDVPLQQWVDQELNVLGLPGHLREHLATMARLHRENRYDRLTHDVEAVTGRQPTSVRDWVADHAALFARPAARRMP
jgi:uncharacterized protein YbjT (DUF2867 family)